MQNNKRSTASSSRRAMRNSSNLSESQLMMSERRKNIGVQLTCSFHCWPNCLYLFENVLLSSSRMMRPPSPPNFSEELCRASFRSPLLRERDCCCFSARAAAAGAWTPELSACRVDGAAAHRHLPIHLGLLSCIERGLVIGRRSGWPLSRVVLPHARGRARPVHRGRRASRKPRTRARHTVRHEGWRCRRTCSRWRRPTRTGKKTGPHQKQRHGESADAC